MQQSILTGLDPNFGPMEGGLTSASGSFFGVSPKKKLCFIGFSSEPLEAEAVLANIAYIRYHSHIAETVDIEALGKKVKFTFIRIDHSATVHSVRVEDARAKSIEQVPSLEILSLESRQSQSFDHELKDTVYGFSHIHRCATDIEKLKQYAGECDEEVFCQPDYLGRQPIVYAVSKKGKEL